MADMVGQTFGLSIELFDAVTGAISFNAHSVDATNDGIGLIFQAEDGLAITHIGFRFGTRTGSTTLTYTATLEGVSATTGFPDGVDVGGGSPTATNFDLPNDSSWDNTWQWIALTNSYTPTRGDFLAITIRTADADVSGANFGSFVTDISNNAITGMSFPYAARLTAASWASRAPMCVYGLRTASTRYGNIIQTQYTTQTASTVGHRIALKFTIPDGASDVFTVRGLKCAAQICNAATSKAPVFGLWSASSVIQSKTLDSDIQASTAQYRYQSLVFNGALTTLTCGTAYYIGFEVADAANGQIRLYGIQATAGDLVAFPGGSTWCLSTYNGSAWSDDTTVRPMAGLILDSMTEPASGGGMLFVPLQPALILG